MSTARKPIQIYLDEKQERILRRLAVAGNVSMAALLRQGADKVIEELMPLEEDPLFGLPSVAEAGGPKYGSEKHDMYLNKKQKEKK